MTAKERETMLDLLCDKFVYGLSEEETRKLEALGFDPGEANSIELTVAALSMADLDTQVEMPASLEQKLRASAMEFAAGMQPAASDDGSLPQREIVLSGSDGKWGSWFGWLGWATAAAASIALAFTLIAPRAPQLQAGGPTPTVTPAPQQLTPAEERRRMIESGAEVVSAEWGPGNVKEMQVSGDVVWSDRQQAGYMRFQGLPKNDPNRETYQLWIFDETQSDKTPIDGGTFDVGADGEVIVPIDAKLKARNPKAFAVTIEKPGGVVVSDRKRIVTLGAVKPDKV